MTPEGIAILIAAAANAATVILGVGKLQQKLDDVRDDIREIRTSIQNCLQALVADRPQPPRPRSPDPEQSP